MKIKLELVGIPVTDVDRAKAWYEKVGFNAEHDQTVSEDLRFVQLTPPGSACSICIGKGLTTLKPGSVDMILCVIEDADKAREDLIAKGSTPAKSTNNPGAALFTSLIPTATNGRCNRWSARSTRKNKR